MFALFVLRFLLIIIYMLDIFRNMLTRCRPTSRWSIFIRIGQNKMDMVLILAIVKIIFPVEMYVIVDLEIEPRSKCEYVKQNADNIF